MTESRLGLGHVLSKTHNVSTCGTCLLQQAENAIWSLVPDTMQDHDWKNHDVIHGEFDHMSVAEIVQTVSDELVDLAVTRIRAAELEMALQTIINDAHGGIREPGWTVADEIENAVRHSLTPPNGEAE